MIMIDVNRNMRTNEKQLEETLKELKDLKYALDASTLFTISDIYGNIIEVNDHFCKVSKYSREELLGNNHRILNSGYHPREFFKDLWDTISAGEVWTGEVCNRAKDGSIFWAETTIVPFLDEKGNPYQYMAIRIDITERKVAQQRIREKEEEIRASEARFRSLIQHANDVILIVNAQGFVTYISPPVHKIMGYEEGEMIGKAVRDYIHPQDVAYVDHLHEDIKKTPKKAVQYQLRILHKKGHYIYCESNATNLLDDPNVRGIVVNIWDITNRKLQEEQIRFAANHDFLTGIPNRRLLERTLEGQLNAAQAQDAPWMYLFLDLDNFKYINDTLGHDQGDIILREVAKRLIDYVGDKGFVARVGGDEFGIIMADAKDIKAVRKQAEQLVQLFEKPIVLPKFDVHLTVSIGVAVYPISAKTVADMMKSADLAMYRAKANGRNQFKIYSPTMDVKTYKLFSLQNDLRKALASNQFRLHYQPKVDGEGRLLGAEALLRWEHPEWGMVPPSEFIEMAEKSGTIIDIGEWVLDTVCQQLKAWQREGLPLQRIAYNISAVELMQANFINKVIRIIERHNIDPKYLNIELTESAVLTNDQEAIRKIQQLKAYGIEISLDDFGKGYSSLNYLKKLRANTVKIDRSFICDLETDPESIRFTSLIIQLAKSLNLEVVAEGVETEQQFQLLKEMGCDEFQGYFFSRPLPSDEFTNLLKIGRCESSQDWLEDGSSDRRQFERIALPYPLEADMTIHRIGDDEVEIENVKVLLDNLGLDGVCFTSNIHLPIIKDIHVALRTELYGQHLQLQGHLLWVKDCMFGTYQYGMQCEPTEEVKRHLTSLIRQLDQDVVNQSTPKGRFISVDLHTYFKGRK